jgi:hypothetical protein
MRKADWDKMIKRILGVLVVTATLLASCTSPSITTPESTIVPIYLSKPSHNFNNEDIITDPQYWNTNWNAYELFRTIISINRTYYKEHTYIEGVFDCNDMVVDMWNILHEQEITAIIVIGNLSLEILSYAECNHAWVLVVHRDKDSSLFRLFAVETTNGEVYGIDKQNKISAKYLHGYYYASPTDLKADTQHRW